ncbi:MAG TPA: PfkB family carbohydrate kinase [Actinophytocola sp.]|uniref:carbohydrate kinase family protein n=1 Tax=Actinophytocola sp. TaxID=1872138 RepID=UPI002DB9CF3C|nr:PfkB family carbohydrate kinase [Actinophytocola sp.]HEU5469910.1 PfkB family carbohydrate kinase [Actinophytocola sp.]
MHPPGVVVVGDAALDVVARHTGPIVPDDDTPAQVRLSMGGAAANTAAWLAHLGVPATLVSRVGADPAALLLRRELTAAGVRCAFTVDAESRTGCVVVLVDAAGRRTMLPDRGANARLHPADLDPAVLAGARHLHLSGYVLADAGSAPAGTAALTAARRAGLTTSVDPQAANLIADPAGFVELIRGVDLFLPNAAELAVLTGSTDPASARRLLDAVGAVAVTAGPAGASWVGPDVLESVPAEPAACVDSTGAGDAFDAGLLAAWLAGASPAAALRAGVRAGTLAVGAVGARPAGQPSIT